MSWKPLAWQLADSLDASAVAYTRDACAPLLRYLGEQQASVDVKRCDFNTAVAARLDGVEPLFLVMRLYAADGRNKIARLHATLGHVSPRMSNVFVFGPSPQLPESLVRCIQAGDPGACNLARTAFDADARDMLRELRALAARYANVEIVDLSEFFCSDAKCYGVRAGQALYWDSYHVTVSAARAFGLQRFGDPANLCRH